VETGVFSVPDPPPPEPKDIMGYRQRAAEPGFDRVRSAMEEWSKTLPVRDRLALERSHKAFNQAYDHFRSLHSGVAQVTRASLERELASRESRKDAARSISSGAAPDEGVARHQMAQRDADKLVRRIRQGDRDAEVLLAKRYVE